MFVDSADEEIRGGRGNQTGRSSFYSTLSETSAGKTYATGEGLTN